MNHDFAANGFRTMFIRLPRAAVVAAALAAVLHMVPFLWAESLQLPGSQFTGNITNNPDFMQYRVWYRQARQHGPVIKDVFTSEPNRPHLIVLFYYGVAKVGSWIGVAPEIVSAHLGSAFAFVLVILLFATVRLFVPDGHQHWAILLAILLGGGLGGHIKFLTLPDALRYTLPIRLLLTGPLEKWSLFEDYRGHYVFTALFDTHFLLLWTVMTSALVSLYFSLRQFSIGRVALTASLCGVMTLLHIHSGFPLLAMVSGVAFLCWFTQIAVRPALVSLGAAAVTILAVIAAEGLLLRNSGLPSAFWSEAVILPTILFLSYPLAWTIGIHGLGAFWRNPTLEKVFLLGWALGATLFTLSGPFYPRPSRGTLTLLIPISIIAGLVYFRLSPRVTFRAAIIAIAIMGATPVFYLARILVNQPVGPAVFLRDAHREIIDDLRRRAGEDDLLVADRRELLWLAPDYPGRHYAAHFFLTIDYERKLAEVEQFFTATPSEQAAFLRSKGVRFLFVGNAQQPSRFETVEGLTLAKQTAAGALFEFGSASR